MQVSQAGIDLIKKHEGLRLRSYLCPAGVWTIGYGTTGPQIKSGMVITKAEAERFLANDLVRFTNGVLKACAPKVPTQAQLDAMVCFSYNLGTAAFAKSSICSAFKRGDITAAANAFMLYNKARNPKTGNREPLPGLTKRRAEEKALFLSDMKTNTVARPVSTVKFADVPESSITPDEPKPLSKSREIIGGGIVGLGSVGQLVHSFSVDDASQVKQGISEIKQEDNSFMTKAHLPEIASGLTVALSLFIIWKRITDRKNGVR